MAAIATTLLCACAGVETGQPTIAVTIEPLRYFAEHIAGDKFRITTIVPGGASPETYEPTAEQMARLAECKMFIKVGNLGMERTWLNRIQANTPHSIIIDSSEGIMPIKTSPEGAADPHTWTSASGAMRIAVNIYRAMAKIDAKDSAYFKKNLEVLCRKIKEFDTRTAKRLAESPHRSFIIYHPSLTYFAKEYGLEQYAIEEEGREPSAATLMLTIEKAKLNGTRMMFVQKEFANRNVETVAKATGAEVVEINPLSYDWEKEMNKITDALCRK